MTRAATFRGQPLLVLVALLGAWLALRVAYWQPAIDAALFAAPELAGASPDGGDGLTSRTNRGLANEPDQFATGFISRSARSSSHAPRVAPRPLAGTSVAVDDASARASFARAAIGHNLLLVAGLAQMTLPATLAAYLQGPPPPGVPAAAPPQASLLQHAPPYTGARWSADAWLMMRQDTTAALASGRPSYGRSQAGGVLRYRLAPSSGHAPQAYLRASSALAGPVERDVVAGLSARPLSRVPLRVALEARVSETASGTELRPAAVAVTELPPARLPHGLRAEAYVQGGYVGGEFATAFVDGQGRVERTVARLGNAEVSAGAGVWGGAQEGAARLDIGPTAAVSFRVGDTRGRVAADYRFRVAGDAEPRSGPALTLSAGF